jgi:hypothetical protein
VASVVVAATGRIGYTAIMIKAVHITVPCMGHALAQAFTAAQLLTHIFRNTVVQKYSTQ